ncbi:MAG TPA: DNA polymerase III subunit delta [Gemmatimonadaceae bacterium]
MSTAALRTLRDALKEGSFRGAYYICGEDDFQKEDAMKQLIAAAVDPATRDFNLDVRRAQEVDARSLDSLLSAVPMMADRRVVVIRDAGSLKKDARGVLERFLENPPPDLMLLLVEAAGGKTDKDLGRMATPMEFEPLSADRIPKWISHHVSTNLGTTITSGAAELLHAAIGNDLHDLVSELDKLASYCNGSEIDEAAVSAVAGVNRGETVVDLLDAVALRNTRQALPLIAFVLGQPKTTAVSVVLALTTQTIALAWGRSRLDEGLAPSRLYGEYFNLLKQSSSVMTGRPWGNAATAWVSAVDRWDRESLDRALDALLTADAALKETRFSSEEQLLTTLVLAMCAGASQVAAA